MAAATIPVLLMNPSGERKKMAKRRTPPRYKSGPKKGQFKPRGSGGTAKRSTKRRTKRRASASTAKTTHRRRRRRRRNPAGPDIKGLVVSVLGGAVVAAAKYGTDGMESITNKQQAFGLAGGGILLGLLASMASKPLGAGIAGGAAALGGYKLATLYIEQEPATQTQGLGQAVYDPYGRFLGYPAGQMYHGQHPQMGATHAQLSAVQADLGATQAQLSAVEADLGAVFDAWQPGG